MGEAKQTIVTARGLRALRTFAFLAATWPAFCSASTSEPPASSSAAAPYSPPPAESFGTLPVETDPVLSPDGHWLAWIDNREARPRVVMFDVLEAKNQRIFAVPPKGKVRALVWSDSQTLLTVVSVTIEPSKATEHPRENFLTIAHTVDGGDGMMLPAGPPGLLGANLVRLSNKPHTVIMSSLNVCKNKENCLIAVDTVTGHFEIVKNGNEHTIAWVVDHNGNPVAREDWDSSNSYRIYALVGSGIKELLRKDDSERPTLVGLLPDESALVLLATNGRPHESAWALPLDGTPARLIAEDPDADITGVYTDPNGGAVIGVYLSGAKNAVKWLDPVAQHRDEVLQRSFPGKIVRVYGWTADGSKTLVYVTAAATAPVYYLVDFTKHRADIAAEQYPDLADQPLGELKEISYKARDGTDIPAYLTSPANKAAGPFPLVVLPHGGPNARDYPEFNWLVQFLASRGYAVLQPQYRGSTGFGESFERAGFRQWGGLMQDDVTDGVNAMIEQGIADPHRVCVVGMDYGGYVALAGAAFTSKLYACAVSINGVSDLQALLRQAVPMYSDRSGNGRLISAQMSYWKQHIGDPYDSALAKKSPINSVAAVTIPVLIVYSTDDAVIPIEQSQKMAQALSAAGKSVSVVALRDEDHWLSRTETRVQLLKELDDFLKAHL